MAVTRACYEDQTLVAVEPLDVMARAIAAIYGPERAMDAAKAVMEALKHDFVTPGRAWMKPDKAAAHYGAGVYESMKWPL